MNAVEIKQKSNRDSDFANEGIYFEEKRLFIEATGNKDEDENRADRIAHLLNGYILKDF